MPFTITDRYQESTHSQTHVLRCDGCGGIETVYDARWDEDAVDVAEERHECPPMCVVCGEPLDERDRAFNVLACLGCRTDDPEGTEAAVQTHIEAMTAREMRSYMERFWKRGAA